MPIDQTVKDRAYKIDPEAWQSYSGKSKPEKQYIDGRRNLSLAAAARQIQDEMGNPVERVRYTLRSYIEMLREGHSLILRETDGEDYNVSEEDQETMLIRLTHTNAETY